MANSNSQRVVAFLLALLFLLTTVGAAAFVIYQLNSDAGLVDESTTPVEEAPVADTSEKEIIDNFAGPYEVPELRFEDTVVGTGETVIAHDTVTIHYTGALATTGVIFDSSTDGDPAKFPLDDLIVGWQEGIPGMKVGGKRRLFIPAAQAYGSQNKENIPPNSDLVFDIELFATER